MNKEDIQEASKILFEHRLNKTGLSSLKNLEPQTIDEAYAIQDNLKLRYLELKDNFCIGKKLDAHPAAQKQMNIKNLLWKSILRYSSKNINLLNSKNFFEPYVEPDISFRIKDDINISKAPFKFKDLDYLLDGLFCSVEIVDFRFRKPLSEIGALNVISTNGASEFWIRDENLIKIKDVDLNNFEVSLLINDTIVDTGNTKNVLDNPLNAVLWLINNLAEKGEPMLKGQFISSGSCTKAFRIYPKSKIKADFNQLGSIEFEYI